MVDFCCCALKPKSFYLLMIFISSSFFVTALAEVAFAGLREAQFSLMATFAIFIILAVFYYNVLSIIAFFHYVINDGIKYAYCSFYVLNMRLMVYILTPLHFAYFLSFIVHPGRSEIATILAMCIYFMIVLTFLTLMYFWSSKLSEAMPKIDDDVVQPMDEESESNEKTPKEAGEVKASEPKDVPAQ